MRPVAPLCLLALFACHDYGLAPASDEARPSGVIEVDPGRIVYPLTQIDGDAVETVTIRNLGDAMLTINQLQVEGSGAFSVLTPDIGPIPPDGTAQVLLAYNPMNAEDNGVLAIRSDDIANPRVEVALVGSGAFPQLSIMPGLYDFGALEPRCGAERDFTLKNIGDADLVVDGVAHVGPGFYLGGQPQLPKVLAKGESTVVTLGFEAADIGAYDGTLHVSTNEPSSGQTAHQLAEVVLPHPHDEIFMQPGAYEGVDVMFWIDGSGSMTDDQANLAANFSSFVTSLEEVEGDYQIMVAADNGCRYGGIITPETEDKESVFAAAVKGGRGWEAGLGVTLYAVEQGESGGCNEGFFREKAKTIVILVSDEPEQSGRDWSDVLTDILSVAPSTTLSAIAGDLPSGCASAAAGYGYHEAVGATGGQFLSICSTSWGDHLKAIATTATSEAPTDTFVLSSVPDPLSLEVTLDGAPTSAWTLDESLNAVVFAAMPEPGAEIRVRYTGLPSCDG